MKKGVLFLLISECLSPNFLLRASARPVALGLLVNLAVSPSAETWE